jgi:hypothetical protein
MAFETLTEDDFFMMTHLTPRDTGLPFHVWAVINARQQPQTPRLRVRGSDNNFYPVPIDEPVEFVGGRPPGWAASDFSDLQQFVASNRHVLLEHWHDRIDSKDLFDGIQKWSEKR